jgi:hypothetical protein
VALTHYASWSAWWVLGWTAEWRSGWLAPPMDMRVGDRVMRRPAPDPILKAL